MPKTKTKRMVGWKGKSYDPKNWKTDPKVDRFLDFVEKEGTEIVTNVPEVRRKP